MNCAACGHENPASAKFCLECGAAFAPRCRGCGTELPRGAKFCLECGAPTAAAPCSDPAAAPERAPRDYTPPHLADKILRSKSALEGERKQVSVLFADVKSSMELSEQVDAEVWHRILERFFAILADGVHRFEGTVNQYTGDGIMALFGAPIAHEDHAQRACYAALQLREEIERYATEVKREHGLGFSARMGIHSGEVVVGKIGDDLRMDYTAQGHSVGLAQRMESLASPGTCYLTAATAARVDVYFELEDLGEFAVKGVSEPVRVHRLVGIGAAHTRFDISRARGLTRFVGRDADMETLEAALAQAQAGHGQVVGVVAEAGTGKSRLCFEFAERCRARGLTVNVGSAVAHGRNIPYLPMLQVFRAYFGIEEGDDDRVVREKIAGRMLLLDEAFRQVLPVLFEFFGVPDPERPVERMDPDAKQRQLFSVLRRIVQGADPRAGSSNFVTLIEDLHWMDAGSEAFLEQWVDAAAGSTAFLLVNFRPEYRAGWMQKSYYRQLPLAPLGPDAIRELLDDLLGGDESTRGLADAIHRRTGGNPFFTEEVVQSLIESGHLTGEKGAYRLVTPVERLEVPASVQALLAARIDRLAEREKQVLQAAAVIGKEFAEPILAAAADVPEAELHAALAALKAGEFVYEQSLYPVAEYAFKHPLTQEVALGSQLAERRQRTHAAVARAIEATQAGKLDEQASLLAHHWDEAGEALVAARWYGRAAAWVGRTDPVEGVRRMQRVLALTDELEPSPERDALRLEACRSLLIVGGWRIGLSREEVERIVREGSALAERAGEVDKHVQIWCGYGTVLGLAGDIDHYRRRADEAQVLARDGSAEARAFVHIGQGYVAFIEGRLADAVAHAEAIIPLVDGDLSAGIDFAGFGILVWSFMARGEFAMYRGGLAECSALIHDAIRRARKGEPDNFTWSCRGAAAAASLAGHAAGSPAAVEARRLTLEAFQMAERNGAPFLRAHACIGVGIAHLLHDDFDDARRALEEGLDLARAHRNGLEREAQMLALLSLAHLGAGDAARARSVAEECIARAGEQGARLFACMGELALARSLRALGEAEAAAAVLDRAAALVEETGARAYVPQIVEERGRVAASRGDAAAAAAQLREAQRLYLEIDATGHAERLGAELAG